IQWLIFGYSLAFGPDVHGLIGNFGWAFLNHVGLDPSKGYAPTVPHEIFMLFELMFAIITPALISGAIVERMRFGAYLLFLFLWATIVYDPLAHWVWGDGGWLHRMGLLDFAGGTVVEIASGVSALVLALMLGKRRRDGGDELRPHNLPMALTGAALLWFGWFGFNAGSAISSGRIAVNAFVDTHIAMAAAAFGWMVLDWLTYKKPTGLGFVSGAIAGGVAITPACGYVSPMAALFIGLVVSAVSFYGIRIKNKLNCDESLDVFGVHGCGGIWGTIATGLFASAAINGTNGLLHGNFHQFLVQLLAVVVSIAYTAGGTYVAAKLATWASGGLRVSREEEEMGLDLTDHGESGYSVEGSGGVFKPGLAGAD
ncbi:MAG TPA: ammonium transporter, partial [Capsulimonadaceae bacterium]|nr:ammonium transporter [Capsulimonadaceae bacterium]